MQTCDRRKNNGIDDMKTDEYAGICRQKQKTAARLNQQTDKKDEIRYSQPARSMHVRKRYPARSFC